MSEVLQPAGIYKTRSRPDRRRKPTSPFSKYAFIGHRRRFRRDDDAERLQFVDRYSLNSVLVIFTGLLLCIADAFFTLQLVNKGAREINPLMEFCLSYGAGPFLAIKYILTGGSLILLLVNGHRSILGGRLKASHILTAVPLFYSLLILWEITLNLQLSS